jgi:hypothetical protein
MRTLSDWLAAIALLWIATLVILFFCGFVARLAWMTISAGWLTVDHLASLFQ